MDKQKMENTTDNIGHIYFHTQDMQLSLLQNDVLLLVLYIVPYLNTSNHETYVCQHILVFPEALLETQSSDFQALISRIVSCLFQPTSCGDNKDFPFLYYLCSKYKSLLRSSTHINRIANTNVIVHHLNTL